MPPDPPALPARIGAYRVISRLGAGGMGDVLLAEDERLQRKVAIKRVLPTAGADPHASRRMLTEARAAARLDHPHICGIYEVGEDAGTPFIVMPVVSGETLASRLRTGPLPIRDALSIAAQAADALAAAHAQGILHRDIKPANLMITGHHHVRVMDFGLAQFTNTSEDLAFAETASRLTVAGTTIGTAAYMSPEQARGQRTDPRSDLFSLGVVLFEMVAGRRPFDRGNPVDGLTAMLTEEPPPLTALRPEAPQELQRIVAKALRKTPEERYQSASDLQVDLRNLLKTMEDGTSRPKTEPAVAHSKRMSPTRVLAVALSVLLVAGLIWVYAGTRAGGVFSRWTGFGRTAGTAGTTRTPGALTLDSLAVLPLVNNSGDPDKEYVADGITQTLIASLSQLPSLRVISRNTAFTFKGKTADASAIAARLAVAAVMTGSISETDGHLVIDVELSDAKDSSVILSQRYVQQPTVGVLALQSSIAQDVARDLRLKLTSADQRQLARIATKNPEAYQLYLKGRFFENRGTPEALHQGIAYYEQAIQRDPAYAQAYAGLAQSYVELGALFEAPRETMPRAKAYANQALEADPGLVDARILLGLISLAYDWDWEAAARALTTNEGVIPAAVEVFSCTAHLLESTGHGPEGERELRKALVTDPLSSALNTELGCGSYYRRRYDAAIQENRDALELDPNNVIAYWGLGRAYGQKKMFREALDELNRVETRVGAAPALIVAEIGYVQAASGHAAEARATLRKLDALSAKAFVDPYLVAAIYVALGDTPRTFEWLDKAYDARSGFLVALASEPKWDSIRSDQAFKDLSKRVGF